MLWAIKLNNWSTWEVSIFRALQTSRVLHISMNARWRMNQLLISVHLIQEFLFSFSLFPSILVQIVSCFEISQVSFLSFLFSFLGFITKKLYGFDKFFFWMIQLSIMTFVPRAFKTYGRFSKKLHLWKQESIHFSLNRLYSTWARIQQPF